MATAGDGGRIQGRTLNGGYNDLPDYVIFAVLLFYNLTIAGLFVLRRTRPDIVFAVLIGMERQPYEQ